MKYFIILILLSGTSLARSPRPEEQIELWRSRIAKSHQLTDLEAYETLKWPLFSTKYTANPDALDIDPRDLEIHQEIQRILTDRSGFAKIIVDELIKLHLDGIKTVREEQSNFSLETYRARQRAIAALRRANRNHNSILKLIPNAEVIRQVGRLYSLPRWTEEEFLRLEGPEFGDTFADSIRTADLVFNNLIEKDDRRQHIHENISDLSQSETWGVWFQDIANGKESFRFKGQKELVNLRSRNASSSSPDHPRQRNGRNLSPDNDSDNKDNKPPLAPSSWILFSLIGASIIAVIIWKIYDTLQPKH